MTLRRAVPSSLCLLASLLLTGCGSKALKIAELVGASRYSGSVHGGQQPIVGATIQLYTVGTTADGSAATPLLTSTVTSDATGSFTITGLYSCTNATQVYIVATGGNPGLSTANPDIALMAALGPCSSLTPSTFINIDEVTTVAAIVALAPYTTSASAIGSSSSDATALASAFTLANQFVDTTTGLSPGSNIPTGYTVPTAELNTLADILSACINSNGGVAGDGSLCGQLFTDTTVGSNPAPTNTIAAMLNLANNPTLNTSSLFALIPPTPPFQPTLTSAPPDFEIRLAPPPASLVLQISPTSIAFPDTAATFTSQPQTITIQNSGSASVTFNSIAITGANASDFAISSNACTSSLAGGSTCTVQVTATPSANGARNAYLAIDSTSPDSPQYVALSVNGTAPSAGPVTLTSSASFSVLGALIDLTLSNTGTTPLNIKSITESDAGQPVYFTIAQSTCGTSLPGQSSCIITVNSSATPRNGSPTTVTGTITVTDDAATGPQTASLTSTDSVQVQAPETYYSNGYAGFVIFPPNQDGYTQTNATAPLTYTSLFSSPAAPPIPLTISGTDAGDFGVAAGDSISTDTTNTSCPSSDVYSTAPCYITVTFTPTAPGTRSAQLSLDPTAGPATGQYVQLTGTGVGPGPSFLPNLTTLVMSSYLPTFPDHSDVIAPPVNIVNTGSTTVTIQPTFTGANASYASVTSSSCASVPPQGTCTLQPAFNAPTPGTYSATLVLSDTSSTFSLSIPIADTTSWWPITAAPTTQSLSFGNQTVGTTSNTQPVLLGDLNGEPLDHAITLSLQPNSSFTLQNGSSCPASAYTLCIPRVAFAPQSAGSVTEYLTATDQVTGLSTKISLSGTGTDTPSYTLSSSDLTFSSVSVNTTSTQTVTLTSNGAATLTVSGIAFTSDVNSSFTQTNNCSTLPVNSTCSINITFAPTSTGYQSANLQITSNATDVDTLIGITGTAQ